LGQSCRGKVYDPGEHVRRRLASFAWGFEDFSDFQEGLPTKFVSALLNMKADQNMTVEFQFKPVKFHDYHDRLPWLKNAKLVGHSVREIIRAAYPTLQCMWLRYYEEDDYFQIEALR
jgi:hypothetical protein